MGKEVQEESFLQRERRLKNRKQNFKMTYKKGLFFNNYGELQDWLKQSDTVIRMVASGTMDDDTEFVTITIEGFTRKSTNDNP